MPFAFAESTYTTEEATITIPFDYEKQTCWLQSDTIYQCTWQGEIEPFSFEDLEEFKHILTDEQYQEEYDKLVAKEPIVIERPVLTETEKRIIILEEKMTRGNYDATDSVELNLLKELNTCLIGQIGTRSSPIQNEMEIQVSDFEHWKTNNVEYRNNIAKIVKNIEACRDQQVLEYKVLSEQYRNIVDNHEDIQFSLLTELEGIQALDYELYTKNSKRIDMNGICDNNQYDWKNKILMGCEDTREYDGVIKNKTSGTISYFSGTLGEYQKYLNENNRYATQADKDNAEKIAEPILKEMLEENSWYNRE